MTEVLRPNLPAPSPTSGSDLLSDSELIALVRAGDAAAYEELFLRHREVAIRYARRLSDRERAEDLCAEAFMKILDLLQRGKGPEVAFRAYLLTTVRTSHLNTLRSAGREDLVPDHEPVGRMNPVVEDPDARFDRRAIYRAFTQLPERWQTALWLTEVEGRNHDEVSEHLGISANAVASLTFRARAGLRRAYLAEHLLDTTDPECRDVLNQLPGYFRDRATSRRRRCIEEHLRSCLSCSTAAVELSEVDTQLGALIAPMALAGLAVGGTAAVKGSVIGTVLANLKGAGSAIGGVMGAKAGAVVTVTALSVAVGAEVVQQGNPARPPRAATSVVLDPSPSPTPTGRPGRPGAAKATAAALISPSAAAPAAQPAIPAPSAATAGPSPDAGGTDSGTSARAIAIGEPTQEHYTRNGARWEKISVPVLNAPEGTIMVVTTDRTIQTARPTTTGTGWSCGYPVTNWADPAPYASTRVACRYDGDGNGGPLVFEYNVITNATMVARLTVPSRYEDTSLLDNTVELRLRG